MSSPMEAESQRLRLLCQDAARELYGLCPEFTVGRPRDPKNGDLASSAALALAGTLKRRPSEIAAEIAARITLSPGEKLEVGDRGFLNLYLSAERLAALLWPGPALPEPALPELALPDPAAPDFCRAHLYHRLRRLLEIHGEAAVDAPLAAPEELRLLRAAAREETDELVSALAELYDRLGLGGKTRRRLFRRGLYLLYGLLGKELL